MLLQRIIGMLCILLVLLWGLPPRLAAGENPGELVDQGVQTYLAGRYAHARTLFEKALKFKELDLDRNRRLGALMYLAFCHIALSDQGSAEETFKRLLVLQPAYQLPAGTSPKIVTVFEEVRAQMPKKIEPKPLLVEEKPPGVTPPGKKPEEPQPEKSSSTWWIWAVVGGVLVGTGVTLALVLSGSDEPTGNAFITIQVVE
jgi:hypothetical protein